MATTLHGIPDAPFKTSWPALVMKRVIRWAVDNGYERVAWTTGEQQAERYDLTKHIGRVAFHDNAAGGIGRAKMVGAPSGGTLAIYSPEGRRISEHHIGARGLDGGARAELEEFIGKELTEKLLAAEPTETTGGHGWKQRTRELTGLDVKTGGEGMKAFYDRNLVNITNDLIKKHGGKVDRGQVIATGGAHGEGPEGLRTWDNWIAARKEEAGLAPAATAEDILEKRHDLAAKIDQIEEAYNARDHASDKRLGISRAKEAERDAAVSEVRQQGRDLRRIDEAMEAREKATPDVHGFDITPELAKHVSGGQPLFKREAAPAASRQPKGVSLARVSPDDRASQRLAARVERAVRKIAPHAEVTPASHITEIATGDYAGGVAWRDGLRHIVAWAVDVKDPLAVGRHEAVHILRQSNVIRPEEWAALGSAAEDGNWQDKHSIGQRYGDLTPDQRLEEAVAEELSVGKQMRFKDVPALVRPIFIKISNLLDHVRDLAKRAFGMQASGADILSRMRSGELGRRFGRESHDLPRIDPNAPDAAPSFARGPRATERDARQAAAQREIDEKEGRAPTVITRLLGNGMDSVGEKATEALERFVPDSVQDIGAEVRLALNPMASGSMRAQAEAKDFANGLREITYSHGKVDEWLAKSFTPAERTFMYDAADEERVIRGRGDTPGPGEGKSRLPDNLRTVVDELQARADAAFKRAQDLGMVKGEGQESYVPAMLVDVSGGNIRRLGAKASGGRGNLVTSSGNLRQRKHATAEETQAAAQRGFGEGATVVHDIRTLNLATGKLEQAMAGRRLINKIKEIGRQVGEVTVSDGAMPAEGAYFTMPEHPAMVTWGPKFEKDAATGKLVTIEGADGKPVMEAKPLYIAKEFEGPLKAVLSRPDAALWRKVMEVKGKMMSVTMYNPLLHNMVIYGKAFPAMVAHDKLGAFTFKTYRDGSLVKKDPALMSRALGSGTVPIGHQGAFQDITSIANEDSVTPGKSWTAQLLAATLGIGSPERKLAIKRAVDKAGDVWHNEFLWNRVNDLQMGLWKAMSDHFQKNGLDQVTADRSASYFANMYAGSVPVEAMSRLARGLLNGVLFSRSFHVTNLGGLKAMIAGLPTDVQAQIMRDAPQMLAKAQGMVRSKAIGSLVTDFIAAWAARMVAAGALAWLLNRAFQAPGDNEEGKKDRVFVGYGPDGTASYMRLPFGKYVEEVHDWFTKPVTYAKQIMFGPTRLALQYLSNDMGFGRKAYDPYDKSLAGLGKNVMKFVGNVGSSFMPIDHGQQLWDAMTKGGQVRDDAAAALAGDLTGFTISHGAPGGPAMGDIFRAQDEHNYRVTEAMPDIRKQIKAGDILGARAKMTALGIPPGLANYYVRVARNPNARMTGRKLTDFNRFATPEQKAQLQKDRAAAAVRREDETSP